ncbi:MAG: nucleotidyltransferase family protein [Clostridiales bacterium]|nr:nucleotidyltransferase family protein [Clostridiales bacterium]
MKVCGIVSEYNPFHLGHMLHIEQTRLLCGTECAIICVMSGNYVQRGDFACMNKHARAKSAVLSGADLVLELPTPYALSSAEGFAKSSVSILASTNIVTHLSFGSELGYIDPLRDVAIALLSEEFPPLLQNELQKGISFASARQKAILAMLGSKSSNLLSSPNNILAIEYIKSLFRLNSSIAPVTIRRIGASHDAKSASGNTASASHLRNLLENGDLSDLIPYMNKESFSILKEEIELERAPVLLKNAERSIVSYLRRLPAEYYERLPDISEGLDKRLFRAVQTGLSFEEICKHAKTKRYAHSRIRRILLCAYLGITKEMAAYNPPYLRVLAFNTKGQALLKQMKNSAELPLITKPASVNALSDNAKRFFELESTATDLYYMASPVPAAKANEEYRTSPIFIAEK